MKRQLIAVGLAAFALLLFASISATVAAPRNIPLLQAGETEPNNNFEEADAVGVPGYVTGNAWNSITDTDYFVMDTTVGREYQASLTIDSPQGLNLRMVLYDGVQRYVKTSPSSSSNTSVSWTAYEDSHYIRVEAVTVSTTTLQTADYRLDVDEFAAPPEPTDTPTPTNTPSPDPWDEYEPNDSFDETYTLPVVTSVTLEDLKLGLNLALTYPY